MNKPLLPLKSFAIGLGLGLASFGTSHAANPCYNATTQADLNACYAKEFRQADAQLQRVYDNYKRSLSPADQRALTASQRLWVQFKEQDCKFVASPHVGGSVYGMIHAQCLLERTENRIVELQNMASKNY